MLPFKFWVAVFAFSLVATTSVAGAAGRGGAGSHGGSWQRSGVPPTFHRGSVHRRGARYRNLRRHRYGYAYGGFYLGAPAYYGDGHIQVVPAPQILGPVIPPTFVLSCHRSQETVTVPAEDGGSRKIRITRC